MFRKCVIAVSFVALLAGSANQSKADAVPVAAASASTAGVWVAGGFIGVVAVLCLYDIWLKVDGQKNWDGTPISNSLRMGGGGGHKRMGGGGGGRAGGQ